MVDFDADCADAFSKFYADKRGGLLERNVFVVSGGGFRGWSENGLGQTIRFAKAGRECNAADFCRGLVVLPAGAGNEATHYAFDGKRLRFAHDHGAAIELLPEGIECGREFRGAENVIGDDVREKLEP